MEELAMPNAKQARFPAHARISAPFIECPDCVKGTRQGRWLCNTCNGLGRIYFQYEPDFVTRIRDWWKKIPPHKRVGYVGMAFLFAAFLLTVAAIQIADRLWP